MRTGVAGERFGIADGAPEETPHGCGYPPLRHLLADPPLHIEVADRALAREYGDRAARPDGDLLGGLIGTVLSQNTSDLNSGRAYTSLRLRFPTWEGVRTAPREAVADAIRSGGLAEIKSARIQGILDDLVARYGSLDLSAIAALPIPAARAALTSLHGVGPKTASCVLLFNLGRPAFPVDTHVHRLARRIGFAPPKASPVAVQDLVEAHLPAEHRYRFHVNLIRHGRTICKAQRPRCLECPIRPFCRFGMHTE
jgi:endonuclease III